MTEPSTTIRAITDREVLQAYFSKDRIGCAYQLGDLDDAYFPWCKWWGTFDDKDELDFALLYYVGLSVPVTVTYGDAARIEHALTELHGTLPDRFYCHILEEHLPGLQRHYDVSDLRPRQRLALRVEDYEPSEWDGDVVRLGHRDTAQIMALYGHYPDNFFEPYQLETGLYFGIHDGTAGPLVSIGGIHLVSEANDVAVIGNIVTHPEFRDRGLARRVIRRLLGEVFERVSLVALNVDVGDVASVKTFQYFDFEFHHRFYEGVVKRSLLPKS